MPAHSLQYNSDGTWRQQKSFSSTWDGFESNAAAKKERDRQYYMARKMGLTARRETLPNQLRKWAGLGLPDGRVCDVFYLHLRGTEEQFELFNAQLRCEQAVESK